MKSIADRKTLRIRAQIAQVTSLTGLASLLAGVVISMVMPQAVALVQVLLAAGFVISVVGIILANRWAKRPRPEDQLDRTLSSLSDQYRLYHYTPLGDHVLLTPTGLVVLEAVNLDGTFTYRQGRWKRSFSLSRLIRYVFEVPLGDPLERARSRAEALRRRASEVAPGGRISPVTPIVVFTHPGAKVDVDGAPLQVVTPLKLSKKLPKDLPRLPVDSYQCLQAMLDGTFTTLGER